MTAGLRMQACQRRRVTLKRQRMAAAVAAAKGDALLESLLTELSRSSTQLKMDQVQAPYYIEYRVNDVDDYTAESAFGALVQSQRCICEYCEWWCASEITNKIAISAKAGGRNKYSAAG